MNHDFFLTEMEFDFEKKKVLIIQKLCLSMVGFTDFMREREREREREQRSANIHQLKISNPFITYIK